MSSSDPVEPDVAEFSGDSGDRPVLGVSHDPRLAGVSGLNDGVGGTGVFGTDPDGYGTMGTSLRGVGVYGRSNGEQTVPGVAGAAGVLGVHGGSGNGVQGTSTSGFGVSGGSDGPASAGVYGHSAATGVLGVGGVGVRAQGTTIGLRAEGTAANAIGLVAKGSPALRVEGDIEVTGDIRLLNADCAEDFDVLEPDTTAGTVMVLDETGGLRQSQGAYDRRVAGVVSGAADWKAGIILDRQHTAPGRLPIALVGKVYCKVDASYAPIAVGDLLTTSPTPGHAMKAEDPVKAFGAVIGKAIGAAHDGRQLLPILVSLQ
jgi:hypothetical protein